MIANYCPYIKSLDRWSNKEVICTTPKGWAENIVCFDLNKHLFKANASVSTSGTAGTLTLAVSSS